MNRLIAILLIAATASGQGITVVGGVPGRNTDPRLTNAQIVLMWTASVSENAIIRTIEQRPPNFDISPEGLIDLKQKRIPDSIIDAMVVRSGGSALSPPKTTHLLKEGSEVRLKFAQALTSKTAQDGDPIEFLLDEDLRADNVVVARSGARAVGSVTHAKKNGMIGKAGELSIAVDYLKVRDTRVKLRGTQGREGNDKTGTTIVLVVLFGVLGFMKHGSNVRVAEGTPVKAFVGQDTQLLAAE
jgi:hypothetical protein